MENILSIRVHDFGEFHEKSLINQGLRFREGSCRE